MSAALLLAVHQYAHAYLRRVVSPYDRRDPLAVYLAAQQCAETLRSGVLEVREAYLSGSYPVVVVVSLRVHVPTPLHHVDISCKVEFEKGGGE